MNAVNIDRLQDAINTASYLRDSRVYNINPALAIVKSILVIKSRKEKVLY